jgi:hypothetical protein
MRRGLDGKTFEIPGSDLIEALTASRIRGSEVRRSRETQWPPPVIDMNRRKSRITRLPTEEVVPPSAERPGWWSLVKAILGCGAAGGLIGASIGAALRTDDYALPAALIGGIPLGAVGLSALSWYGWLFGRMNRLRHGSLVGGSLGLLGAGTLGVVLGLSVWALPWSLAGAILGAMLQSLLTRPERRSFGLFTGVAIGSLVGILLRAVRTESDRVTIGASYGALIGAVLGVFLIPALLAWLLELPTLLRKRRKR